MVSKKNKSKPLTKVVNDVKKTKKVKQKKYNNKQFNVQTNDESLIEKSNLDNEIVKETLPENKISNETAQLISKEAEKFESSKKKESFRRVKEEEVDVEILKKIGKNAFKFKKGCKGSWGEKANNDLIKTRGKTFRHEKNKKKRGSYSGGRIDMNSYSIKFNDSD